MGATGSGIRKPGGGGPRTRGRLLVLTVLIAVAFAGCTRDLGRLQFGHQERGGILGKDTNPDTIEGIVLMLKYENPSRVLEGVHRKIDELQAELAPMGVKIVPYIDRDDLVKVVACAGAYRATLGRASVALSILDRIDQPDFDQALKQARLCDRTLDWSGVMWRYLAWCAALIGRPDAVRPAAPQ